MSVKTMKLGELIDITSGFAFDSQSFSTSEGIPLIRIRDVGRSRTDTYYNGSFSQEYVVHKGDILITMDGEFRISEWLGPDALLNQRVCRIETSSKLVDRRYLLHLLPAELKQIEDVTPFVTVKHLSVKKIREIIIPIPLLAEQIHIAQVLDQADRLRQLDRKLLTNYDQLVQAVFMDMFGDISINTKGWPMKTLRGISLKFNDGPFGSNLKSEHYAESGVRIIRLQNIGIGKYVGNDKAFIPESHYKTISKYTCLPGDVVIATMGDPNVRACIVPSFIEKAVNKADCVLCRPNQEVALPEYICWLLNSPRFMILVQQHLHGQTRVRVSMGQLAHLQVPIPPIASNPKKQQQSSSSFNPKPYSTACCNKPFAAS
jgi:type I restriction enzyme S subunit